jgi:PAS domain S-box-containing protein
MVRKVAAMRRGSREEIDERLRLLVESITDYAIYTLDPDGRITSWNPGAERLLGYSPIQAIGTHFSEFYPEDDVRVGAPDRELAAALSDGRTDTEGWRVRRDGTRFWASVVTTALRGDNGGLRGFGRVVRDLTERKQSEDALRESEQRFRLLVETAQEYAIFMLDPEGYVMSWNAGAERIKGYRAEEIIGRHFSTFYPDEDIRAQKPQRELEVALADGRVEDEGWRVRRDGSLFWANVTITAIRTSDGELAGFGKVTRDLTERKQGEDSLRSVLAQERQLANRLRELDRLKSDLVAMVAHDLRAPMAVISGFAETMLTNWDALPEVDKIGALRRILANMRGLSELVDSVLETARIEAGELVVEVTTIDVASLVQKAVLDATPAEHPDRVQVELVPQLPAARADERRTWQVLMNLIGNALKFSQGRVFVSLETSDTEIEIAVRDEGPGIDPADHDHLFERFGRIQQAGFTPPGAGLGLFIAKSIVEAQGGRIWVESELGRGARFVFTVPRDD